MNEERCFNLGHVADRIFIGARKSTSLVANGGGLEPRQACTSLQGVYNISPYDSNAMKSKNPRSGIQAIKTSRTLDLMGANPNCNQGGR